MYNIHFIFILLFCLLIFTIYLQKREPEKWFWIKIISIYLSYLFTFYIGFIKIPLLIIIVFFIIKKKSKVNRIIKYQALTFSLFLYISVGYILPQLTFSQIQELNAQIQLVDRFDNIDSTHTYTSESPIQEDISRFASNRNTPEILFATWVYDQKGISIKDYDWIWYDSYQEYDVNLSVHNEDQFSEVYMRFNQTGEEFLGIFKKENNGDFYLKTVIKGEFKVNTLSRWSFMW